MKGPRYNVGVGNGRGGQDSARPTATVTGYLARKIGRARKLGGGVAPAQMSVAPEVFEELVVWWRRKSRFNALLGRTEERPETDPPQSIFFDGVEIFPDEDARLPRSIVELPEYRRF